MTVYFEKVSQVKTVFSAFINYGKVLIPKIGKTGFLIPSLRKPAKDQMFWRIIAVKLVVSAYVPSESSFLTFLLSLAAATSPDGTVQQRGDHTHIPTVRVSDSTLARLTSSSLTSRFHT